jgi:Holliday junction resolvase RusA-like endonuclease
VIEVMGEPAPKGSGRAIVRGGRAVHIASGSDVNQRNLRAWDTALRDAARRAIGNLDRPPFVKQPLRLTMVFRLRRPAGHYARSGEIKRSAPAWPAGKPDGSKLQRSTEDALTGIIWDDDSRVVEWLGRKRYASAGEEGVWLVIEPVDNLPKGAK